MKNDSPGNRSDAPAPRRIGRSILAVAGGFILVAVLSTATDQLCHATGLYPPAGRPMPDALWLLAWGYRLVFQSIGGGLTARWAPHHPMRHVWIQGWIGTALCAVAVAATWNQGPDFGPKWYSIGLTLTALPSVWIGGRWLGSRGG